MSPSFAAEPAAAKPAPKPGPAWGAEDVQPTPEHPVYFRWSLGHFPGAQPPLEFQDGTPTTREAEYPDRHDPKIMRKKMIPDFAGTKSKNILKGNGAEQAHPRSSRREGLRRDQVGDPNEPLSASQIYPGIARVPR